MAGFSPPSQRDDGLVLDEQDRVRDLSVLSSGEELPLKRKYRRVALLSQEIAVESSLCQ